MVLKEYWPRCLQELIEFQQIANAEQPEFEKVVSDVKSAVDDFFLVSLSEYGCERWEKILGLSVEPGDTLQDRRDRILIKYLDQLPYTYRTLLKYLATVSEDFTVTLNVNAYDLYIPRKPTVYGHQTEDVLFFSLVRIYVSICQPARCTFLLAYFRPNRRKDGYTAFSLCIKYKMSECALPLRSGFTEVICITFSFQER